MKARLIVLAVSLTPLIAAYGHLPTPIHGY